MSTEHDPELPQSPVRLDENDVRWLQDRLIEVAAVSTSPDRFNAGLAYLTLAAWDMTRAPRAPDIARTVSQVMALIDQPGGQPVPVLAAAVGLSVSQLNRVFRSNTGMTVTQYRHERQLRVYCELYGAGRCMSSVDAAHAAGFGSYAQFHRVFTRAMGCSPTEYRRRI